MGSRGTTTKISHPIGILPSEWNIQFVLETDDWIGIEIVQQYNPQRDSMSTFDPCHFKNNIDVWVKPMIRDLKWARMALRVCEMLWVLGDRGVEYEALEHR